MNLLAFKQPWPLLLILLSNPAFTAFSTLASFSTTNGSLPLSANIDFFMYLPHSWATFWPLLVLPVNLSARTLRSARIYSHWASLMCMLEYSPLPKPASLKISSKIIPHLGVVAECLSMIEFPSTMGGMQVLNGSQMGKFHGTITRTGPSGWWTILQV